MTNFHCFNRDYYNEEGCDTPCKHCLSYIEVEEEYVTTNNSKKEKPRLKINFKPKFN